jgi:hypothetical protein
MRKDSAVDFFGGVAETAQAIGISSQAVSDWPDELPPRIADRVIAAAVRMGREVPPQFLNKPIEHDSSGQQKAAA